MEFNKEFSVNGHATKQMAEDYFKLMIENKELIDINERLEIENIKLKKKLNNLSSMSMSMMSSSMKEEEKKEKEKKKEEIPSQWQC